MPKKRRTRTDAQVVAKRYGLTVAAVDWLRGLPNYDPFAQADDCYFDQELAHMWVERFPLNIVHAKGRDVDKPFQLSQWQQVQIANFYGWYRPDGVRRYNYCFEYVAKKNGKTAKTAAWLLLELRGRTDADYAEFGATADRIHVESGAELYSAASSRDQAAKVFEHAAGMVLRNPAFGEGLNVLGHTGGSQSRVISNHGLLSAYKCMSADANTADGSFPYFYIADEMHRHKSPELCTVLENSAAAHDQPIGLGTTTADYARESVCNEKLAFARRVCANKGDPDKPGHAPWFLPAVYEVTPEQYAADPQCFKKPKYWRMANPNLGVTVTDKAMSELLQKAEEQPSSFNDFLRLHLNIVTESAERWIDMTRYDHAKPQRDLESLRGAMCFGGLDLSAKRDLTGLVLAFPYEEGDGIDLHAWAWIPEDQAKIDEQKRGIPYTRWAEEGHITLTPGDFIDHSAIREFILELADEYNIRSVAHDPWNSAQLAVELEKEGLEMLRFRQGLFSYNEPTKETERLITAKQIRHGDNPVLRWCFQNVQLRRDNNGNMMPDKGKSQDKIDLACAAIMAVGGRMREEVEKASPYSERGLLVF